MKFQVLSDLHLDCDPDRGAGFIRGRPAREIEGLILAGDVMQGDGYLDGVGLLVSRYERVLYVPGNHEYYKTPRNVVEARLRALQAEHPHVRVLDNDVVTVDGARILGTPLWFPDLPAAYIGLSLHWSDFICIPGFRDWVHEEHRRAVRFLSEELRPGDTVISHYLPSWKSVSAKYRDDPCNVFFVGDMERLMVEREPALWIHGHTHTPCDYQIGRTRVLCNPRGYPTERRDRERRFRRFLTVDIAAPSDPLTPG